MTRPHLFADFYFYQLFSSTVYDCIHYDQTHDHCFSSALVQRDQSFVIDIKRLVSHQDKRFLPILNHCTTYTVSEGKPSSLSRVLDYVESKLAVWSGKVDTYDLKNNLQMPLFKRLTYRPLQGVRHIDEASAYRFVHSELVELKQRLYTLQSISGSVSLSTISVWSASLSRFVQQVQYAIDKPTTKHVESVCIKGLSQLRPITDICKDYLFSPGSGGLDAESAMAISSELLDWVSSLLSVYESLMIVFQRLYLFKTHACLLVISELKQHYSDEKKCRYATVDQLRRWVDRLTLQEGALKQLSGDITMLQSLFESVTDESHLLSSTSHYHYITLKNKCDSFRSLLTQKGAQQWFDYINTCFSASEASLQGCAATFLELYADVFDWSDLLAPAHDHISMLVNQCYSMIDALPKDVRECVSFHHRIPVDHIDKLESLAQSLSKTWYWLFLVGLSYAQLGRLSLLSDCITLFSAHSDDADRCMIGYLSTSIGMMLSSSLFEKLCYQVSQDYCDRFCFLVERSTVLIEQSEDVSEVICDAQDWWNSIYFLNRLIGHTRYSLFKLSLPVWEPMFDYWSSHQLMQSDLVHSWFVNYHSHELDRQCCHRLVYYYQGQLGDYSSKTKLTMLYLISKQQGLSLESLQSFSTQYDISLTQLQAVFKQMRLMQRFDVEGMSVGMSVLVQHLIALCSGIERAESSYVVLDMFASFQEELLTVLALSLREQWSCSRALLSWIVQVLPFLPTFRHRFLAWVDSHADEWKQSDVLISQLQSVSKSGHLYLRLTAQQMLATLGLNPKIHSDILFSQPVVFSEAIDPLVTFVHDIFKQADQLYDSESSFVRTDLQCRCKEMLDAHEKTILSFVDAGLANDLAALWHFSKESDVRVFNEKKAIIHSYCHRHHEVMLHQHIICQYWLYLVEFVRFNGIDDTRWVPAYLIDAYSGTVVELSVDSVCYLLEGFDTYLENKLHLDQVDQDAFMVLLMWASGRDALSRQEACLVIDCLLSCLSRLVKGIKKEHPDRIHSLFDCMIKVFDACDYYSQHHQYIALADLKSVVSSFLVCFDEGVFIPNHAFVDKIFELSADEHLYEAPQFRVLYQYYHDMYHMISTSNESLYSLDVFDGAHRDRLYRLLHFLLIEQTAGVLSFAYWLISQLQQENIHSDAIIACLNAMFLATYTKKEWIQFSLFSCLLSTHSKSTSLGGSLIDEAYFKANQKDYELVISCFAFFPNMIREFFMMGPLSEAASDGVKKGLFQEIIHDYLTHLSQDATLLESAVRGGVMHECLQLFSTYDDVKMESLFKLEHLTAHCTSQLFLDSELYFVIQQAQQHLDLANSVIRQQEPQVPNSVTSSCIFKSLITLIIDCETHKQALEESSMAAESLSKSVESLLTVWCRFWFRTLEPIECDSKLVTDFIALFYKSIDVSECISGKESVSISKHGYDHVMLLLGMIDQPLRDRVAAYWFIQHDLLLTHDAAIVLRQISLFTQYLSLDIVADIILAHSNAIPFVHHLSFCCPPLCVKLLIQMKQQQPHFAQSHIQQLLESHLYKPYYEIYFSSTLDLEMSERSWRPLLYHIHHAEDVSYSALKGVLHDYFESAFQSHDSELLLVINHLYCMHPSLFWAVMVHHQLSYGQSLIDDVLYHFQDHPLLVSLWMRDWFEQPTMDHWLSQQYLNEASLPLIKHPVLIDLLIQKETSLDTKLSSEQWVEWMTFSYQQKHYLNVVDRLRDRLILLADLFVEKVVLKRSLQHEDAFHECLFICLSLLSHDAFDQWIHRVHDQFDMSFSVIIQSFLEHSFMQHDSYFQRLMNVQLSHYLYYSLDKETEMTLSNQQRQFISFSSLCSSISLSLTDIIDLVQHCQFFPAMIARSHLIRLVDALKTPAEHHYLVDFSLQAPDAFQSFLVTDEGAKTLQHIVFYGELDRSSLLYEHVSKALRQLSATQCFCFLYHYVQHHLNKATRDTLKKFLNDHVASLFNQETLSLNTFKDQFFNIVNRPLMRVPAKDTLLQEVFQGVTSEITEHRSTLTLIGYMVHQSETSQDYALKRLWMKKQFEQMIQHKLNRVMLFHILRQHDSVWDHAIFSQFIKGWETKDSFFHMLDIMLADEHERFIMKDYLNGMVRHVLSVDLKEINQKSLLVLISSVHFLLAQHYQKEVLIAWLQQVFSDYLHHHYLDAMKPLMQSYDLHKQDVVSIFCPLMTLDAFQYKSRLLEWIYERDIFVIFWDDYLSFSKTHRIYADVFVEGTHMYELVSRYTIDAMEKRWSHLYLFCQIHYEKEYYLDPFFARAYDYYFKTVDIDNIVVSTDVSNAFVTCVKEAIIEQHIGFLHHFARFLETSLIPQSRPLGWLFQIILDTYRIPFQTMAAESVKGQSMDPLFKAFIKAGFVDSSGFLCVDISQYSIHDLTQKLDFERWDMAVESFIVRLQSYAVSRLEQRELFCEILIQYAPSLFITNSLRLDSKKADHSAMIYRDGCTFFELGLHLFSTSQGSQLLFHDMIRLVFQYEHTKPLLYVALKQLDTTQLYPLLLSPHLGVMARDIMLFGVFHDDSHHSHSQRVVEWQELVISTMLKDLNTFWGEAFDASLSTVHLEVLSFFYIQFSESLYDSVGATFPRIFSRTHVSIWQWYRCHIQLQVFCQVHDTSLSSLEEWMPAVSHLYQQGFGVLDIMMAYRASKQFVTSVYSSWVQSLLHQQRQGNSIWGDDHVFSRLLHRLVRCPKHSQLSVSFFKSFPMGDTLKRWLTEQGLLDGYYGMTLFTYEQFIHQFDPLDIYTQLQSSDPMGTEAFRLERSIQKREQMAQSYFQTFFLNVYASLPTHQLGLQELTLFMRRIDGEFQGVHQHQLFMHDYQSFCHAFEHLDMVDLLDITYQPFIVGLLMSDDPMVLDASFLDYLTHFMTFHIDLNHKGFSLLSSEQKQELRQLLLHYQLINQKGKLSPYHEKLIQAKSDIKHHHQSLLHRFHRYMSSQRQLLKDVCRAQYFVAHLLYGTQEQCKASFVYLFFEMTDHQWLFVQRLFKQSIDQHVIGERIQDRLSDMLNRSVQTLTKESCKQMAKEFKDHLVSNKSQIKASFDRFYTHQSEQPTLSKHHVKALMDALADVG